MKKDDEFYVSYIENSLGKSTKKTIKRFAFGAITLIILSAVVFGFTQKPFKNSTFELTTTSKITGIFYETPYPMLRVELEKNIYKNILLLGFGKSSANPFLEKIKTEVNNLNGKTLQIEGNLIYYNGKTLLQITNDEKVTLLHNSKTTIPQKTTISQMTLQGEIIDPKCYFGVMKPGKGKIHRSCAVRCITGGIPPVMATSDNNNIAKYFLITDQKGNALHQDILPYIGKPSEIKGMVEKLEDWYFIKINVKDINILSEASNIY